jgi:hypothetical protein
MTPEPASLPNLTDAELHAVLDRALRTVLILGVILFVVFTWTLGWQSGVLELAGAAISYTGIGEWRRLTRTAFSKLDNQQPAQPVSRTLVLFFLRLGMVGVILYVSLRCLHGNVYALLAGIGLAVVGLTFEAVRLLRS